MKNIFVRAFLLSTLIIPIIPQSSWALVTARATYGILTSKQDLNELCQGNCTAPSNATGIVPTTGMGFDGLVKLPLVPVGFGLRYEKMGLSASANGIEAEANYTRTAVLVNYRLIDTIVHFGPIASYGISHSGGFTIKENGSKVADMTPDSMSSYSLGLELEVKPLIILPLVVGAEAGIMGFNWKDAKNSVNGSVKDINMSGNYVKLFIGLDI